VKQLLVLTVVVAASFTLAAAPVSAQELHGMIDLEASLEAQIAKLERLVGRDAPALTQVVALQWLIELYTVAERHDDVVRCYRTILALYPSDVATLNSYGRFLMEVVGDHELAGEVLRDAHGWARSIDARAVDLGETYQLRAELFRRTGKFERSVQMATMALELMSTERSTDALLARARSHVELSSYDAAAEDYLRLIAIDRGVDAEIVNELELIVSRTTSYREGSIDELIDEAIERYHEQYATRIVMGGGTLVGFPSADGATLEGTLREAKGNGAVLFVHDTGARRSVFTPYAQLLFIDDISSLALDMRGHGGSRADSMLAFEELSPYNRNRLADDVVAAYRYLRETLDVDEGRIAIVAAGAACAVVEKALYRGRITAPVVYLSPTFTDVDRELETAISFHADTPVLIICAREDIASMRAIKSFTEVKERRRTDRRLYDRAGHGVETLRRVPAALEDFQDWLRSVVGPG
jgi:tetratricopeptide (TPR) repeat protein